jgi:hypothetical protein
MDTVSFLLDEQVPEFLMDELFRLEPAIAVNQVGLAAAPPKGTKDPELLVRCETQQEVLITIDKRTMIGHLIQHFALGRHTWGVVMLRPGFATRRYSEDLVLMWSAYSRDEWRDSLTWLPL